MPESDDIADMMDLSSVAEFLESLQTLPLCRRLFGWRKIRGQAWQAAFALEMISEEYREKISAYRRTMKRFEDDACRAYAQYYALLDEKQSSADWPSDRELRDEILRAVNRVACIVLDQIRRELAEERRKDEHDEET